MIRRIKKLLGRYKNYEQILITPYRSYATAHHLYVYGRVLDNEPLKIKQEQNFFKTVKNTYKQFDSFEIPEAEIELHLPNGQKFFTQTNGEGYFVFDKQLKENLLAIYNSINKNKPKGVKGKYLKIRRFAAKKEQNKWKKEWKTYFR